MRGIDGGSRPEHQLLEGKNVVAQRAFILGSAIYVIEDAAGKPFLREKTKIVNVHDPRRCERVWATRHVVGLEEESVLYQAARTLARKFA